MSNEPVKKSIGGVDYLFCRLPVKQSMKQIIRIMKIAGPAMGAAANSLDSLKGGSLSSIIDADLDFELVISNLCANLNEDSIDLIVDVFMENILVGAEPLINIFDPHFQEHGLGQLAKVVTEAVKVEYGSFFAGKLGGLMGNDNPGITLEK